MMPRRSRRARLAAAALVAVGAALAAPGPAHAADPLPLPPQQFLNVGSEKCLDVRSEEGSSTPGAHVQQYNCKKDDGNQLWNLVKYNGFYLVQNSVSGLCLDVIGGGNADGTPTQQWHCTGSSNQLWDWQFVDGYERFVSVGSGKCLDVRDGSHDNHATVQQWGCNHTAAQQWMPVFFPF